MLDNDARAAMIGLRRSAAGCRYAIARWERLESLLAAEGTWFGRDRIEAIELQGFSAVVEDLYFSEDAYLTWLDCLAAQPDPKRRDIDLIVGPRVVPKAMQDRGFAPWPARPVGEPGAARGAGGPRAAAAAAREAMLRVEYEEPARAAAGAQALSRHCREEAHLLREQR